LEIGNRKSAIGNARAFTLVEILVVVALMSLIVLALMSVFNATQSAFRAGLTQTDVLEGGRSAMGMIKSDLEGMTPSFGQSNNPANNFSGAANFYAFVVSSLNSSNTPLVQTLLGGSNPNLQRTNVLENFFILSRNNTTWTGVGYAVNTFSTNSFNPLYRFSMSTNVMAAGPAALYTNFLNAVSYGAWTNMSHLQDGVVHLTVRAYDPNGLWMTNTYPFYNGQRTTTNNNVSFFPPDFGSDYGETGFLMFSNTLPATVEIQLGLLEDRTLQRAESLAGLVPAQSNYLASHAGQVHVFRQRVWIRNVDPSAYQ
jgi:prepilin-type N-terminal cleavage/methylation domain-containing protein